MESAVAEMSKSKPRRPSKESLVKEFRDSLSPRQWNLMEQMLGRTIPSSPVSRYNLLNTLFHKTISVAAAKDKGRGLQQWVCQKISEFTGLPWGKDEEIASREGGQNGSDVRLSMAARLMFPFTVECKSGSQWNIPYAIKQAQSNLYPDTAWMVVIDRPHRLPDKRIKPIILMDGEQFFRLLRRAEDLVNLWKERE